MKAASAGTLALLSSGQWVRFDLYAFTLASGQQLFIADADMPVTVGAQLYSGGLVVTRGSLTQSNDLAVQQMELQIAPQFDIPGGPPTVGGFPFLAAAKQGLFDGAFIQYSRLIVAIPTPPYTNWPDTTPGATAWFKGVITDVQVGRQKATFQVHSTTELLNVQMPRNLVQAGCQHMLYDAGCTLLKATFRVSGTVTAGGGVLAFNTNLTNANGYFDLGVITFTSGVNNGVSRTVRSYLNASGNVKLLMPLNTAPANGDTFTILPGDDKQQATCTTKFVNLSHFRGFPYVPVPETQYDGTSAPPAGPANPGHGSGPGSAGRYKFQP